MSYGEYHIQSSQTRQVIISDGTEKEGTNIKTSSGKPCIPSNAVSYYSLVVACAHTFW
jgi:hypothetical protein